MYAGARSKYQMLRMICLTGFIAADNFVSYQAIAARICCTSEVLSVNSMPPLQGKVTIITGLQHT